MTEIFQSPDSIAELPVTILKRPEEIGDCRPTLSLHLLVKNGESCVSRLLDNVGSYVDEIVAVANDCTDRTVAILEEYASRRGSGFRLEIVEVTYVSHPDLYILDVPESYSVGTSLVGESLQVLPCTGQPLLADWAAVRNLGWRRCTKDWILFLDADDVVEDPECLPGLCEYLARYQSNDGVPVEMAASRYIFNETEGLSLSESYRERLAKNVPHISWSGIAHEVLVGASRTVQIAGNLVVRDLKDNQGAGIRIPGRCLKILYQHARENDWVVSPRELIYLAMEARPFMLDFAAHVLEKYLTLSLWLEERAWACCMRGEIDESKKDWSEASKWYAKALAEYPSSKAAFRLCRSRFMEQKWQDAVDAYHVGIENKDRLQILDHGPGYEDLSKILLASALDKLDRRDEALTACEEALKIFPQNSALRKMYDQFKARI